MVEDRYLPGQYRFHAEVYDDQYAGRTDLAASLAHYLRLGSEARGPVLDVGCGTGRILLPLMQAGVEVEGIDLSDEMLLILGEKALALGLSPKVRKADMRRLALAPRFDLALIPFRSFSHLYAPEDQLATLRGLRTALRSGGRLCLDVMGRPPFEPDGRPCLVRSDLRHPRTGRRLIVWNAVRHDPIQNLDDHLVIYDELDDEGEVVRRFIYPYQLRRVLPAELAHLAALAGFAGCRIQGDFDGSALGPASPNLVAEFFTE